MREPTLNGQEMEEKQEEGGREKEIGSEKKKKLEGDQTNRQSFSMSILPSRSFISASISFNPPLSLSLSFSPSIPCPFLLSLLLSFPLYICPSLSIPPSIFFSNPSLLKHLLPSLVCCTSFPLCFYFFCVTLPPSPFISCFSLAFFPNTLLSHYLSPSIVVVVDYVIRAEDMSFLSTRFSAQHDYTKPLSTVYRSRVCALA